MQHPRGWVSRDTVIGYARSVGLSVSNHQLLRWVDAGLFPKPKRVGMGQGGGKGTVSYYPHYSVLQAVVLAAALQHRRNLDDAGWAIWVFGFPVTQFARELLIHELSEQRRVYRALLRKRRPAELSDRRLQAGLQVVMGRAAATALLQPRVLSFIADLQAGSVSEERYSDDDLGDVQYAITEFVDSMTSPDALKMTGANDLPDPKEIRQEAARFARTGSIRALQRAVREIPEKWLRIVAFEAQALTAKIAESLGGEVSIIDRPTYLRYLRFRLLDRGAANDRKE